MGKSSINVWARRRARRALMQAVYAWQMTDGDVADIAAQFDGSEHLKRADEDYFNECLRGVLAGVDELDPLFEPYLDRRIDQLDYVERAILRAGSYEMKARLDVPVRVVIDEWVELAKRFGAQDSFRYINGVLDRVARDVRGTELAPATPSADNGLQQSPAQPGG
ncbi:MAG: transcription antitermination factor NusB [Pseudomonadales bacterium]|nr:transcription antitermination factor NusB [Pseudomonadales bacterium]